MAVLPTGIGPVTGGYQIERSLRFNSADSANLTRTFGSAPTNDDKATISLWVKRTNPGAENQLYSARASGAAAYTSLRFDSTDELDFLMVNSSGTVIARLVTTAKYRDPSAWYHIVFAYDSTDATSSNRLKLYVNGVQVTVFNTATYPAQNTDLALWAKNTVVNYISREGDGYSSYLNGYMTEVNFIDGQALTPSSFGETDSNTGVWKPKAYTGTYGTNGFFLKFADNSGTTSTTLGKDSSGNGNNWTPNNFSVTAGSGNDSLVDSPTSYGTDTGIGGSVRGNYATLNPLKIYGANFTYSNGNLQVTDSSSSYVASIPTLTPPNSGKWYWEVTVLSQTTASTVILGLATEANAYSTNAGTMASYGRYRSDGDISNLAGTTQTSGSSYTTNDVIGVALDVDSGTVRFYKNGVAQGATPSFSFTAGTVLVPYIVGDNTAGTKTLAVNFGQRPFAYTAPSGFKALCTQNLPTPTIGATSTTQANDYFNTIIWTGNNNSTGTTRTQTGVGFQPDFVWIKNRSNAYFHNLYDSVRGTGSTKNLSSNTTGAEGDSGYAGLYGYLSAFQTDGFQTTNGTDGANSGIWVNALNENFVAWNWKANGAGSSNTAGTITSTVSANTTSGFSIVTYTGNGSANQTVGHGLGVAPAFGILKDRDTNSNNNQWQIFHTAAGDKYGYFTTAAFAGTAEFYPTSGSSTTVTIARGSPAATTNESGDRFVMYLFAPVAGYSAFGSYTGNGSTDGPFVYANHRPAFVLIKRTDTTSNWTILDFQREGYNVDNDPLFPNLSNAEGTTDLADLLSNGFKLRSTDASVNASGGTYIYMSLASNPFKYSLAR